MTQVFDYTRDCFDGNYGHIDLDDISIIWIHRIGPGIGLNVVEIARFFKNEGRSYTGGNMAYHYVNTFDQVQQALPLDERGAHGRKWANAHGLGFAQLGDFRESPPSTDQWMRAVDVCADLVPWLSPMQMQTFLPPKLCGVLPIIGHGEVPYTYGEGSGKEHPGGRNACPGKHWDMDEFRQDVRAVLNQRHGETLEALGHRFTGHGRRAPRQKTPA